MIDVLAVVGIVGIMAVSAVPYIRDFQPRLDLDSAKKQIASDLRYARQLTVTEQISHGVEFDENMESYKIIKMNSGVTSTVKYQNLAEDVGIKEVVDSSDDLVEFNFYGGVDESCEVILEHAGGDTGRVIVKPSGYIDVQ